MARGNTRRRLRNPSQFARRRPSSRGAACKADLRRCRNEATAICNASWFPETRGGERSCDETKPRQSVTPRSRGTNEPNPVRCRETKPRQSVTPRRNERTQSRPLSRNEATAICNASSVSPNEPNAVDETKPRQSVMPRQKSEPISESAAKRTQWQVMARHACFPRTNRIASTKRTQWHAVTAPAAPRTNPTAGARARFVTVNAWLTARLILALSKPERVLGTLCPRGYPLCYSQACPRFG